METHFGELTGARRARVSERIRTDLKALARDAEELLKATAGDVSERAHDARVRLTAAVERARALGTEVEERTVATVSAAAKQADTTVRTHPYESIGLAFGVGVIVGLLLTRE